MVFTYDIYPVELAGRKEGSILGSNPNGILIVYTTKDETQLEFLHKVLAAVKIEKNAFLSLSLNHGQMYKIPDIYDNRIIEKIIIFGDVCQQICFNFLLSKYQITSLNNKKIIYADSLHEIQTNQQLKKKLWMNLKELFEV